MGGREGQSGQVSERGGGQGRISSSPGLFVKGKVSTAQDRQGALRKPLPRRGSAQSHDPGSHPNLPSPAVGPAAYHGLSVPQLLTY